MMRDRQPLSSILVYCRHERSVVRKCPSDSDMMRYGNVTMMARKGPPVARGPRLVKARGEEDGTRL